MLRGRDTLYSVLGSLMCGMAIGKHPIAYPEPQGASSPHGNPSLVRGGMGAFPNPPLQFAVTRHSHCSRKAHGCGCCDLQMLEDWLLEGMQLRSQLRVGKWRA